MLPQASRRANRGVRILIDLPDQSQDNNARVQRGLGSSPAQVPRVGASNEVKVHRPGFKGWTIKVPDSATRVRHLRHVCTHICINPAGAASLQRFCVTKNVEPSDRLSKDDPSNLIQL